MDQRIESFLGDVLALAGEGGAARPRQVRGNLPAAGAEEAHEGPSGSRLPRAVPRSRSRGVAAPQGNAHRRALEAGAQHHRRAGTLSLPERRFPPPWTAEETEACYIVRDANGQALAYMLP
jgi:hypothetical protein